MTSVVLRIGALSVLLTGTTFEVCAQARGGAMPERVPSPRPERMARAQHPLDRWAAMPSKQREAALAKKTPEEAAKLRQRIANWEAMTPEQKDRARHFAALPAAQKQIVKEQADWMKTLPPERRLAVRKEVNSLQSLSPEARQAEIESPSFGRRFDAAERERISKLITTMEQ